jgi:hypothetical protein
MIVQFDNAWGWDFNDHFIGGFARVRSQRLRDDPRWLVYMEAGPMIDLAPGGLGRDSGSTFATCRAVMDDFGDLVQVTPWK